MKVVTFSHVSADVWEPAGQCGGRCGCCSASTQASTWHCLTVEVKGFTQRVPLHVPPRAPPALIAMAAQWRTSRRPQLLCTNIAALLIRWGECRLNLHSTCKVESDVKRPRACVTVSGPSTGFQHSDHNFFNKSVHISGSPCVFPFVYSGKVYTECAEWVHGGEDEGKFWCSTK